MLAQLKLGVTNKPMLLSGSVSNVHSACVTFQWLALLFHYEFVLKLASRYIDKKCVTLICNVCFILNFRQELVQDAEKC